MNLIDVMYGRSRGVLGKFSLLLVFGFLLCLSVLAYCRWTGQLPAFLLEALLVRIKVPPGFKVQLYATNVPNARSMALGSQGTVFVGTRRAGKVYALCDLQGMGKATRRMTIARGLNNPNGVAFREGALYVAEMDRILRFDNVEARLKNPPSPVVLSSAFPSGTWHGWKFIRFGPDGWLYVSVGAPCNVCESSDDRYATIMRMHPDGSHVEVFARGVRNTMGFDWHPKTGTLWFTDNGRDWLGDNLPPDELNHAPRPGMHFGFPFCHGKDIPDPEFGWKHPCRGFAPPALELGAHVAALGMRFYSGEMFPPPYHNQIFIAERGSWNRSTPVGYRVTRVELNGDRAVKYEPFAVGWLLGRLKWGRPVDVLVMPDGALLISDDYGGAIYRVTYQK